MGTRGCVAWRSDDGSWLGVYNHWDSYPTGLGIEVYKEVASVGIGNVIKRLKSVGDWREYLSGGVCEYCGKVAGQPHSISGVMSDLQKLGLKFPDPEVKHHEHGDSKAEQYDPRQDPLSLEWVYILNEETNSIEVWSHVQTDEKSPELDATTPVPLQHDPSSSYCLVHVHDVDLAVRLDDDAEIDKYFEMIENTNIKK